MVNPSDIILKVLKNFKNVQSLLLLCSWEDSVNKGGIHTDKLRFIAQFQTAIDDEKITHETYFRRWALNAKG